MHQRRKPAMEPWNYQHPSSSTIHKVISNIQFSIHLRLVNSDLFDYNLFSSESNRHVAKSKTPKATVILGFGLSVGSAILMAGGLLFLAWWKHRRNQLDGGMLDGFDGNEWVMNLYDCC